MEGLLSLLLFAALFYFMMRFGCGAHMVHGHGSGHGEHAGLDGHDSGGRETMAKDPVCGMEVAPGQGYTKMQGGREYRLCSRACLDKFDANPDQYASQPRGGR